MALNPLLVSSAGRPLTMLYFECEGDALMKKTQEGLPSHGVANKVGVVDPPRR